MDGIRTRSSVGGIITLVAALTVVLLFISQILLYWQLDVTHTLELAPSFPLSVVIPTQGGFSKMLWHRAHDKNARKRNSKLASSLQTLAANRIDVSVHITFPHLNCKVLDYSHNGAKFSTGDFAKHNGFSKFTLEKPNEYDYAKATQKSVDGLSRNKISSSASMASEDSCTIKGRITVPRIGGDLSFFLSEEAFRKTAKMVQMGMSLEASDERVGGHDTSHYIHEITFGKHFPLAKNPLKDTFVKMDDPSGIGLHQMSLKLVPTVYKRFMRQEQDTFQLSSSAYIIKPDALIRANPMKLPGLNLHYDFNPIAVTHMESRENFFVFISSLIGIVGGVFVSVGLVSGMIVSSAKSVFHKQD
jgi:hypothetical protein